MVISLKEKKKKVQNSLPESRSAPGFQFLILSPSGSAGPALEAARTTIIYFKNNYAACIKVYSYIWKKKQWTKQQKTMLKMTYAGNNP